MSCLIGAVNEASAGAFDVFDAGVGGLDLACGGARHDEKFDLFPPPANGPVEPGRLGLVGFFYEAFKVLFGGFSKFPGK